MRKAAITSSDQDTCGIPIQDYCWGTKDILQIRNVLGVFCPFWHDAASVILGHSQLRCRQSRRWFPFAALDVCKSANKSEFVSLFPDLFFVWVIAMKYLLFLQINTSRSQKNKKTKSFPSDVLKILCHLSWMFGCCLWQKREDFYILFTWILMISLT